MSKRYLAIAAALSITVVLGAAAAGSASARSATAGPRRSPSSEGGQQPRIINGHVSPQAGAGLPQAFRSLVASQSDIAWIGYSVPIEDRDRTMCCFSSADGTTWISGTFSNSSVQCCGACRIEPAADAATAVRQAPPKASAPPSSVKLEGSDRVVILFRIAERRVERIRMFTEDCELDAGGRAVHWLQDVRPAESIALLESLVGPDTERKNRVTNSALSAIAMHAEPGATTVLERLARAHASASVRGEAIFWLGQKAGRKAVGTISEAIEKDPETDVKKRAVFALSQLPKSEGVPLLIDVARKNQNPAVRKQAIFWLGQSRDPRALEFFTEILK
jgi:hypothetical protein